MDWADEHYVKLYTRRTATSALWPWQARALLGPFLCAVNKAGVVDVGTRRPAAESIAALVMLPVDLVAAGLAAWLEDGTVELHGGKLVMPHFLEAQEARKTPAAASRDYREKQRDIARAKEAGLLDPTVMAGDEPSSLVMDGHPPTPALPCPAPKKHSSAEPTAEEQALADLWNSNAPKACPRVAKLEGKRLTSVRARVKEDPELLRYRAALARMRESPFLRGERGDWRATFDWFLKPQSLTKIEEGAYDNRGPPGGSAARAPVEPSTQWKPEDSEGPVRGEVLR